MSSSLHRYPHAISHDINSNPEFATMAAAPRQNSLVAGQLFALRNAVGHLRNAYNGLDVEWNDVGKWLVIIVAIFEWNLKINCFTYRGTVLR